MELNMSSGDGSGGSSGESPSGCGLDGSGCCPGSMEEQLIYSITIPLSSAIVLANLLIILAISCNRQLHTTPNYFFLSLLVADLCTGVALPFIPWMGLNRPLSFGVCLLVHVLPNFLFLAFLLNLVVVHYDRYRSIVSPLRYRSTLWLHRRFTLVLLAVWVPPLLFALLPAFGWNSGGGDYDVGCVECCCMYRHVFPNAFIYLEVCGILVPAILSIVVMTARVLWITHSQLKDIRKLQRSVLGHLSQTEEQAQGGSRGRRQLGVDLRYARCVAAVSLTFLACWVPYIIYTHVGMVFLLQPGAQGNPTAHIVLSCAGIGGMTVVPLVLGLANREYTAPFKKFLRKLYDRWRLRSWCSDTTDL